MTGIEVTPLCFDSLSPRDWMNLASSCKAFFEALKERIYGLFFFNLEGPVIPGGRPFDRPVYATSYASSEIPSSVRWLVLYCSPYMRIPDSVEHLELRRVCQEDSWNLDWWDALPSNLKTLKVWQGYPLPTGWLPETLRTLVLPKVWREQVAELLPNCPLLREIFAYERVQNCSGPFVKWVQPEAKM